MKFLKWDTPLQFVLILLITAYSIYAVFLQVPKSRSLSIQIELGEAKIPKATLEEICKQVGWGKVDVKVDDKNPSSAILKIEKPITSVDIEEFKKRITRELGKVKDFTQIKDGEWKLSLGEITVTKEKIINLLKEFGLQSSFISIDPINPNKILINCKLVEEATRKALKDAFSKTATLISYVEEVKGSTIKLGLDLRSGTHLRLQLVTTKDIPKITPEILSQEIQVLQNRINELGTFEPIIQPHGEDSIIVDLPEVQNPEEAVNIVSKTAFLEFKELANPDATKEEDKWKTVMTGDMLKSAQATYGSGGAPIVSFTLTPAGAKKFAEITERNLGKPLAIFLDGNLISAPEVKSVIPNGEGQISGEKMDEKECQNLARYLRAGALPVPLEIVENQLIGPTLGEESLKKSLHAGLIGLIVVSIFMIIMYRLPGVMADLALIFYGLVLLAFFSTYDVVLTLPGIAGFILSIGMAVDANVLIFERLKEELWAGRTLKNAVSVAFERAFTAVLDTHVTTFIGALVMYYLGSSTIKGFGFTLALGTVVSLVTAVYVTKVLIELLLLRTNLFTEPKYYGA